MEYEKNLHIGFKSTYMMTLFFETESEKTSKILQGSKSLLDLFILLQSFSIASIDTRFYSVAR